MLEPRFEAQPRASGMLTAPGAGPSRAGLTSPARGRALLFPHLVSSPECYRVYSTSMRTIGHQGWGFRDKSLSRLGPLGSGPNTSLRTGLGPAEILVNKTVRAELSSRVSLCLLLSTALLWAAFECSELGGNH